MVMIPLNFNGITPAADFTLPVGPYVLEVVAATIEARSDGNGQRMSVQNRVVMGPGLTNDNVGRTIYNNYMLSDKGAPFIVRLYVACGISEQHIQQYGGQLQTDWLQGRKYVCLNQHRKTDDGKVFNNITGEKPISEWDTTCQGFNGQSGPAGPSQSSLLQQPNVGAPPVAQMAPPAMGLPVAMPGMPGAAQAYGAPQGGFPQQFAPQQFAPQQPQQFAPQQPQQFAPQQPQQFAAPAGPPQVNPYGHMAPPAPGVPQAPQAPALPTPPAPPPPGGFSQ